jgi:hypothetical protein
MINLIRRDFTVELPLEEAWRHLARVEQWPSWARHIVRIELRPSRELGPGSTGLIHLKSPFKRGWPGSTAAFTVTEFNPGRNWKWVAPFLWLTCHYDHWFEELGPGQTRLTWLIEAEGFGASIIGRLFAMIYRRSLDRAIPLLVEEMNASRADVSG